MDRWIAVVDRRRFPAVLFEDRHQAPLDLRERLVPRHWHVTPIALDHGGAEAIGILVQLLEGRPLRADEAPGEDVVAVTTDPHDTAVGGTVALDGHLEPARRLTQRAGAKVA